MKPHYFLVAFVLLGNFFPTVFADQSLNLSLTASKTTVASGETFSISLIMKEKNNTSFTQDAISIPGIENFEIQGTSNSSQFLFSNNEGVMEETTTYSVIAKKAGIFKIGPISYKGASSQDLTITVTAAPKTPDIQESLSQVSPSIQSDTPWTLESWIFLAGGLVGVSLLMLGIYVKFLTKKVEIRPTIQTLPTSTGLATMESIAHLIRIDLENRYHTTTKHLTYGELLCLEEDEKRKELLQKILSVLQLHEYGNTNINLDELNTLVRKFLAFRSQAQSF